MPENTIILFILLTITTFSIFKFQKNKQSKKRLVKTNKSTSKSTPQLKVIISESKITGSVNHQEIKRVKQKTFFSSIEDLLEIKSRLIRNLEYVGKMLHFSEHNTLPLAAGKSSTLQVNGKKILDAVKEREKFIKKASEDKTLSSEQIKTLIQRPYILENDACSELLHGKTQSALSYTGLIEWINKFEKELSEIRILLNRESKKIA